MVNRTLLFLLLLIPCLTGKSSESYTPAVDSLLNLIHTTSGKELMYLYPKLHTALYEMGDIDLLLKYNNDFTEAAKALKIKKAEALSYTLKVEVLFNYWISDSLLLAESFKAMDFMRDIPGTEVDYFFTAQVVGEVYLIKGNYGEALKYAERLYEEAKKKNNSSGMVTFLQMMGKAYEELNLFDKAEISFRESILVADEATDKGLKCESYRSLVEILNRMEHYEQAIEVNKEFESFLKRIDAANGSLKILYHDLYLGYATSYIKLGEYNLARKYISRAEEMATANIPLVVYSIEYARFNLLFEEKKYAEAEKSLKRIDEILEGDEPLKSYKYIQTKKLRADLYYLWGLYDKAAGDYHEYIALNDSLQKVELTEKIHSIRTLYEIDKLEMQQEQERHYFRSTIKWLITVLILLFTIIIIIVLNIRSLKTKNRILAEKAQQWASYSPQPAVLLTTAPDEEDKEAAEKLYTYITETQIYRDPALTLDSLAAQTGITRNKLSRAINRTAAQNFKQYINEFRIREVILLMDNPEYHRLSLDELMEQAGFNSRSTFYESFKKITGLTPAQYWKERR